MSGSGGSSSSRQETRDIAPAQFAALRTPFSSLLGQNIERARGFDPFGEPDTTSFAAPITRGEAEALREARTTAQAGIPGAEDAFDLFQSQIRGDELLDIGSRPEVQNAIRAAQRPTEQALQRAQAGLPFQSIAQGQSRFQESTPFFSAAADLERAGADALADIAREIVFGEFQAAADRRQEATEQSSQLAAAQLGQQLDLLEAEALPRLVAQLGIDRGLEEFERERNVLLNLLDVLTGTTGVQPGTFARSSSVQAGFGF